eukprot:SAG11_NODE_853_length_6874_cov_1.980074_3_plen_106_part_00
MPASRFAAPPPPPPPPPPPSALVYATGRCHAFVLDISREALGDPKAPLPPVSPLLSALPPPPQTRVPSGGADLLLLCFVVSAIAPALFQTTVANIATALRPGAQA